MRLLRVELHRFRARRAIALMLLGITLLVAWMTLDTVISTRPVSEAEIAAAKQQAAQEEEFYQEDYERCLEIAQDPELECALPDVDYTWFLSRAPLSLEEEVGDTGKAAVIFLAGIAVIIGATFAGADWATGSMGNQLLFRPRRLEVWAAKGVAVALGVTAAAAVVIAAQWGIYFLVAEARDIGHGPGVVDDVVQTSLRGLALVAGGGLGGFALTMLLRSTVGTLALVFFYSVGGEALVAVLPVDRVSRWSPSNNVFAWLDNGIEIYDDSISCGFNEVECMQQYTLGLSHGALYLSVLLAIAVAVSVVLFRRRDVP